MNIHDEQTARLLDEYITARQRGSDAPSVPDLNAAVVLIEAAQSARPDPNFTQQLEAALMERFTEKKITPSRTRNYRWLAAAAAVVLLIGAVYLATPGGRAFAQSLFRFFSQDVDDADTVEVWAIPTDESGNVPPTPTYAPLPSAEPDGALVLPADVVEQAPFDIWAPSFTPDNYDFSNAVYYADDNMSRLVFTCNTGEGHEYSLRQRPIAEEDLDAELEAIRGEVGASAVIEPIQIRDVTAEFVEGDWVPDPDQDFSVIADGSGEMKMIWDSTQDSYRLIWYEDGYLFQLATYSMMVSFDGTRPCATGRDVYVDIAESLQP